MRGVGGGEGGWQPEAGYTFQQDCLEYPLVQEVLVIHSVEQYYNTVIVIDYQLQIPLHFGSTTKTKPCEYHFNLLTQSL